MTIVSKKAPAAQAKPKGGGFGSHHGRNSVKHVGVLRGAGTLVEGRRKTPATYQIDVYEGRNQKSGSGALYGVFKPSKKVDGAPNPILRLEDGSEVEIVILGLDEEGVDIETRGDIPGYV